MASCGVETLRVELLHLAPPDAARSQQQMCHGYVQWKWSRTFPNSSLSLAIVVS